jgi:hypothetical protein
MSGDKGPDDVITTLVANKQFRSNPAYHDMPAKLTVRFVRVKLATGEYEVLATSLLDQNKYPPTIFKELYYYR